MMDEVPIWVVSLGTRRSHVDRGAWTSSGVMLLADVNVQT